MSLGDGTLMEKHRGGKPAWKNSNFNFANTYIILQINDGIVTHYDSIYYKIVTISSFIELKIYNSNSSDINVNYLEHDTLDIAKWNSF